MKKSVFTKFDRLMAAVTFAEEGEFNTAQEFMCEAEYTAKRQPENHKLRKQQLLHESN